MLFLPAVMPLVIAGVSASSRLWTGIRGAAAGPVALYDTVFAVLAWGVFEHVVTE